MSRTRKARPARLDADRTAKPLTEIKVRVHVTNSGKVLPHAHEEYVIRDMDPGRVEKSNKLVELIEEDYDLDRNG